MGGCFSTVRDTAPAGLRRQLSIDKNEAQEATCFLQSQDNKVTLIDLSISASGIVNLDTFSKSDPIAVLREKQVNGGWREIGRTEVIANTTEPRFVKMIRILYMFSRVQAMQIQLYDVDTDISDQKSTNELCLHEQDYIGEMEFSVSELFEKGLPLTKSIQNRRFPRRAKGTITVRAEDVNGQNDTVKLRLRAEGLTKRDFLYDADPFLVISRMSEDDVYTPVFKTEVLRKTVSPAWDEIVVSVQQMCNGDFVRPLKVECFDWFPNGSHSLMGQCVCSMQQLKGNFEKREPILLMHPANQGGGSGRLHVDRYTIEPYYSFLDYVAGGLRLNFMVAIDFTQSNRPPNEPGSLHFMHPSGGYNQYQAAIVAVGKVLEFYDTDKHFPVWGFGGAFAGPHVSHCFPLNGNPHDPEVVGVQGILDAYAFALQNTRLAGPTLFTPVISMAMAYASQERVTQENQEYFVLLIITDGVIADMVSTIGSVVKAADLPLSILIVGVGNANFSAMEALDADKNPLTWRGKQAARDIVQFVPLAKLKNTNTGSLEHEIAQELLAELPYQVLNYMTQNKIRPNDPSKCKEVLERQAAKVRKPVPPISHSLPMGPQGWTSHMAMQSALSVPQVYGGAPGWPEPLVGMPSPMHVPVPTPVPVPVPVHATFHHSYSPIQMPMPTFGEAAGHGEAAGYGHQQHLAEAPRLASPLAFPQRFGDFPSVRSRQQQQHQQDFPRVRSQQYGQPPHLCPPLPFVQRLGSHSELEQQEEDQLGSEMMSSDLKPLMTPQLRDLRHQQSFAGYPGEWNQRR